MGQSTPLVSVIMPVYNAEKYVEDAINSILDQTYKNFELIVIDDGSTDSSFQIIEKMSKLDERIITISQSNQGIISTLNKGIEISKGEFIARMDADDISLKERLSKQVYHLAINENIILCGGQVEFIGAKSGVSCLPADIEGCSIKLFFSTPVFHPTVMFKKTMIKYNVDYKHSEDYKLWSDMKCIGDIDNINEVLLKYRIHENQISRLKNVEQLRKQLLISKNNLSELLLSKNENCDLSKLGYCSILKMIMSKGYLEGDVKVLESSLHYNLGFFGFDGVKIYLDYVLKNKCFNINRFIMLILRTFKWRKFKFD